MFLTDADAGAVKLTVDGSGFVWYLEGEQMPHCSGQTAEDFVPARAEAGLSRARVIGSPENVPLVLGLYHFLGAGRVEVCSPLCGEGVDRQDPGLTLFRMRGHSLPPSLGGWHRFGRLDLPSYLLAYWLHPGCCAGRKPEPEQISRQVRAHPAWPALSFIDHLDEWGLARVLAAVIDPRWFVDPHQPDGGDKLEQYLGLTAKASGKNVSRRAGRRLDVQRAWDTLRDPGRLGPRRFIYRERGSAGKLHDARASRLFVSFLRQVWTAAVCDGPQAGHLFVPEYFFTYPDEAAAFRDFVGHQNMRR